MSIHIFDNPSQLYQKAAEQIVTIGRGAIAKKGQFALALSGGSTPAGVYAVIAQSFKDQLDWQKVHLFWGDERCVVATHPESNYRMAHENLISKVSIPSGNVHRVASEEDPLLAAQQYEDDMRDFFGVYGSGFPEFDLILLGLGDDGHTASLFPESEGLHESERWVCDNFVKKLKTHRVTITFPLINHAANVMFIVSGSSKASICHQILEEKKDYPAQKVQPNSGQLFWFLDNDAGNKLKVS